MRIIPIHILILIYKRRLYPKMNQKYTHHVRSGGPRAASISLACVMSAVLASTSVLAQDSTDGGADDALEEVVVLGQKQERTLQETVDSVRVLGAELIEEEGLTNFYDIFDRTVNTTGEIDLGGFNIRGIDSFSVSGGGTSFLASVYVDGAPLSYRAIREFGFSTWDVQQVEILRGPQSTLQGRNALAGAVVMTTVDPTWEWDFRGRLGYGEEDTEEYAVAFGGPIVDDQFAFRITGEKQEYGGYIENPYRDHNTDYAEDETYRAKLLFEPDALPGFRAILTVSQQETDQGVAWITPDDTPFEDPQTEFNDPTHSFTESTMGILRLEYDLNEHWGLSSTTSYSDVDYGYEWDGDAGPEPISVIWDERNDTTWSQEFLGNFDYDAVSGVVGAYFSDLDVYDIYGGSRGLTFNELGIPLLLVAPPEFGGLGLPPEYAAYILSLYANADPAIVSTDGEYGQTAKTAALFTDVTWSVIDQLDLLAGLRYDREKQENWADTLITILNADQFPDPFDPTLDPTTAQIVYGLNQQFYALAEQASGTEPPVTATFDAWLPKAGATWHWSDDMSTSFVVQRGYRSGGVGSNIARARTYTYDPEYVWNYELSFRSSWLDDRLVVNANLFYLDWEDQQVNVQLSGNSFDTEVVNSGASTVKGFELETFFQITDHWSGYAGLGLADTNFDEFTIMQPDGAVYDLSGRAFSYAPEHTANVGVSYFTGSGFTLNVNANYQSESKAAVNPYASGLPMDDPRFDPDNDARTLVNLRTGYAWDNVGLYLVVSNLLDEEYIAGADTGSYSLLLGRPRLATVRLEVDF